MGEYGPGMTFQKQCNLEKKKIKAALEGFELDIDTDDKYPISKERAGRLILDAYDEAVYQAIQAMQAGRAMEAMLKKHGVDTNTMLKEYKEAVDHLEPDDEPYEYEDDDVIL